jgi:hypothetical protein
VRIGARDVTRDVRVLVCTKSVTLGAHYVTISPVKRPSICKNGANKGSVKCDAYITLGAHDITLRAHDVTLRAHDVTLRAHDRASRTSHPPVVYVHARMTYGLTWGEGTENSEAFIK